ncbi:MAG: hypothetical protein DRP01_09670 [Archaeoglobales archaeon]|nr:MAG: hypothetical protein DRP01_09670 [Archaeoglobales archaeon]
MRYLIPLILALLIPVGLCEDGVNYPKHGDILGPHGSTFISDDILEKIIVKNETPQECGKCHVNISRNFVSSLHYTTAGMLEEFNKASGKAFGIEMPKACLKCHTLTCSKCHGNFTTAHTKKVPMEVCVECHHSRTGVNYVGYLGGMKAKAPHPDVHYEKGLECMDCHKVEEIHGDGKYYKSEKLAVKVRCEDCHKTGRIIKNMTARYDPNSVAHRIHDGKLACYACHAGYVQTCYNCHLETKKVDKSYIDKFWLIKGHDGRIKPAYLMVVSYKNKTHVGWVEYCPHTITEKAKSCNFCHEKAEIMYPQTIQKGDVLGPSKASFIPVDKSILGIPVNTIGYGLIVGVIVSLFIHAVRRWCKR